MRTTSWVAVMLVALTACKNNVKETGEIIDLPRAETPSNVTATMDSFFQEAATDSMDIHSVMIVRDGSVIYSRWQSEGVDTVPHVLHSVSKTFTATAVVPAVSVLTVLAVSTSSLCLTRTPSSPSPPTMQIFRASSTSCGSASSPYYN